MKPSAIKYGRVNRLFLIVLVTLGILSVVIWEGKALQRSAPSPAGAYSPELMPVYLITFGYEWKLPAKCGQGDIIHLPIR